MGVFIAVLGMCIPYLAYMLLGQMIVFKLFPSIAIALTMLSFTFFGDGVRDALDPKMK